MNIAATRFNNQTFLENKRWRETHQWKGCIYGSPKKITDNVPKDTIVTVIEINNSKPERIMGFGTILNHNIIGTKSMIYSDNYYNQYIYRSNFRIDRTNIKHRKALNYLEEILFRGKSHLKRARGITLLPFKIKNDYFILPMKLTRHLIIRELDRKIPIKTIIKKFTLLRVEITKLFREINASIRHRKPL